MIDCHKYDRIHESATITKETRMLIPRQPVPGLQVDTVAHGNFNLAAETPQHFTMLVFYRGLHCPICTKYLTELARLLPEFAKRGVGIMALSSDTRDRAAAMAEKINASSLRVGYGLSLQNARAWGLYISDSRGKTSIGIEEPTRFAEPGVFLVRPDGTLYYGAVQTMPFARPNFTDLVGGLDFAIANNYPARGEYAGPL
jgi:peroxiredoxin